MRRRSKLRMDTRGHLGKRRIGVVEPDLDILFSHLEGDVRDPVNAVSKVA